MKRRRFLSRVVAALAAVPAGVLAAGKAKGAAARRSKLYIHPTKPINEYEVWEDCGKFRCGQIIGWFPAERKVVKLVKPDAPHPKFPGLRCKVSAMQPSDLEWCLRWRRKAGYK